LFAYLDNKYWLNKLNPYKSNLEGVFVEEIGAYYIVHLKSVIVTSTLAGSEGKQITLLPSIEPINLVESSANI